MITCYWGDFCTNASSSRFPFVALCSFTWNCHKFHTGVSHTGRSSPQFNTVPEPDFHSDTKIHSHVMLMRNDLAYGSIKLTPNKNGLCKHGLTFSSHTKLNVALYHVNTPLVSFSYGKSQLVILERIFHRLGMR